MLSVVVLSGPNEVDSANISSLQVKNMEPRNLLTCTQVKKQAMDFFYTSVYTWVTFVQFYCSSLFSFSFWERESKKLIF